MSAFRAFVFLLLAGMAAYGADCYFGGTGDTNSHWASYRLCVATNSFTWMAYTLDSAKPFFLSLCSSRLCG
jgi:hypothetical protein